MNDFPSVAMYASEPSSEERDVVLTSARPRALRMGLYGVVVGTVVLTVSSIVLQVPRQIELPCVIKSDSREQVYRYAEDVFVEQFYVRVGETVRRGMPLVRISSPQIAALVMEYTLAQLQEELFEKTELPVHAKTQVGLRLQREKVLQQLERTHQARRFALATQQAEIRKLELAARNAREQLEQLRKLRAGGYASDAEVQQAEFQKAAAEEALHRAREQYRRDIAQLESQARELALERSIAGQSEEKVTLELQNRRAQLQAARHAAYQRLRTLYGDFALDSGAIIIKAPDDGLVVTYRSDAERQVPAGAVLLKLSQPSRVFYATAEVQPKDIGSLQVGQPVVIELSTFPPLRWGVLRGKVRSLSLAPGEQHHYTLEAEIDSSSLHSFKATLRPGMEGRLIVIVEERPLAAYVFDTLLRPFEHFIR
ncbi:MAG: HlyD family efflux transporter periplasmic adaptor subunit [Bacteroidota bacterium]|nr:HlyD family efflux transporter periplasmic adaptor subunit [Candidatus Kapabacteria bacterium]MCX7937618.1 HlyD family efflux transporter periplasmic adaptor subunit [Chlorobiota bacterium]MDW8271717.1 HlyD family efflux transporter periplasmic adaptor subunit [Bacteroidota bacterium]